MTALSRSALETEIASLIADNTSGNITPANVRQVQNDTADSCFNNTTDTFANIPSGAISCTTIAAAGNVTLGNGIALQSDSTTAHTLLIQGYQTTSSAYATLATITNGSTATLAIAPAANGAVTINGAVIGGTTPAAGTFTALSATTGYNGLIGGVTPAAATFTTATTAQVINTNTAVVVTTNAGTVPVTKSLSTFTNSSAATMTITLATASAIDGQISVVRIYDFSAAAETITWTNTENSTVTAPTTSNGSTTLPLTVTFMYNGATSKWRCINKA